MPNPAVSGMESLQHLTDKTQRFLLAACEEEKRREELLALIEKEKAGRDALSERNRRLQATIAEFESRRNSFDDKVTTLIDALGEIPLREIS
jgi:uncharacterized coiled-coil DUF342 family protein